MRIHAGWNFRKGQECASELSKSAQFLTTLLAEGPQWINRAAVNEFSEHSGRAEVIDEHKKRPEAGPQVVYHQGQKIDYAAVFETTYCTGRCLD
jgi:hypothetical protein